MKLSEVVSIFKDAGIPVQEFVAIPNPFHLEQHGENWTRYPWWIVRIEGVDITIGWHQRKIPIVWRPAGKSQELAVKPRSIERAIVYLKSFHKS